MRRTCAAPESPRNTAILASRPCSNAHPRPSEISIDWRREGRLRGQNGVTAFLGGYVGNDDLRLISGSRRDFVGGVLQDIAARSCDDQVYSLTRERHCGGRMWEKDLLARYLERFAELTGSRPDFDESFRHYREQMVHALLMWTITLCHSPLLPNMQPEETTLTMIERITTAMADLDSLDNL